MTWGSNASFEPKPCRFCGGEAIDDKDSGLSTHEMQCHLRYKGRLRRALGKVFLSGERKKKSPPAKK